MKRVALLLLLTLPMQPATSKFDRLPTQRKIDLIEKGKIPPGTQLLFAEKDLNSFLATKAKEVVPEGMRQPRVELHEGSAIGSAFVDFVKMRHASGEDLNWLMRKLLEGEHPMTVSGRVISSNGIARVELDNVDIGGSTLKGRALDLLVKTFVLPLYPQAKVGKEFELGYNMDRIEIKQGAALVVMAPKK